MMTSFDYNYQNALRQAIVFSIFSFVKLLVRDTIHLHNKGCSEMHSGSCSQVTPHANVLLWRIVSGKL